MRREFDIRDEWVPFEIHPKLPVEGVPWSDYFRGMDSAGFFAELDGRGKGMGVRFNHQPLMHNTRRALMGGEFAREHGRGHEYHDAVFAAYFTDCRNIGDMETLRDIAASVGLNADAFEGAVADGRYEGDLTRIAAEGRRVGATAAPTFVIDGYGKITGAQPEAVFRTAFEAAST